MFISLLRKIIACAAILRLMCLPMVCTVIALPWIIGGTKE